MTGRRRSEAGRLAAVLATAVATIGAGIIGLGASKANDAPPQDRLPITAGGAWTPPVVGIFTSGFGERCLGGVCKPHTGVDIANLPGTPVVAVAAGLVAGARCASRYCDEPGYLGLGGYGNLVTLSHADGLQTRYAHLQTIAVTPGQQVNAGAVIGYMGATGNVTGPHLHFEVMTAGGLVDPVPVLAAHQIHLGPPR